MLHVPKRSAILGATTSLGFVPALVMLVATGFLHGLLGIHEFGCLRLGRPVLAANLVATSWMLGVLAAAYLVWLVGVARRKVTAATGGGFAVAAAGLLLRVIVEMPQVVNQVPLALAPPPEPYGTWLALARGFGIVAVAFGLACVLAACLSERNLRRSGPAWTLPR